MLNLPPNFSNMYCVISSITASTSWSKPQKIGSSIQTSTRTEQRAATNRVQGGFQHSLSEMQFFHHHSSEKPLEISTGRLEAIHCFRHSPDDSSLSPFDWRHHPFWHQVCRVHECHLQVTDPGHPVHDQHVENEDSQRHVAWCGCESVTTTHWCSLGFQLEIPDTKS